MKTRHVSAFFLLSVLTLLFSRPFSFAQAHLPRDSHGPHQVNVTGRIELEKLAHHAGRQSVTITFLNLDQPFQYEGEIKQAGQVHFHLQPGHYIAIVRGAKWLAQRVEIDATKPHVTFSVLLPGGDANGDNRVDWDDLDILTSAFPSQPGMVNWDERADLDCDGDVDDTDADIMFANFNRRGD